MPLSLGAAMPRSQPRESDEGDDDWGWFFNDPDPEPPPEPKKKKKKYPPVPLFKGGKDKGGKGNGECECDDKKDKGGTLKAETLRERVDRKCAAGEALDDEELIELIE